jgi:hypothetical protein
MRHPQETDPILPTTNMAIKLEEKKRVLVVGAGAAGIVLQKYEGLVCKANRGFRHELCSPSR